MEVIELVTGLRRNAFITEITPEDLKILTKRKYAFDWKACCSVATVYKIQVEEQDDILGVVGLIHFPREERIEIKLIATAIENRGRKKRFDMVTGNLIAFVCRMAYVLYGENCCVSLIPKTNLIKHYIQKYYMRPAGQQLLVDGMYLKKLLNDYPL